MTVGRNSEAYCAVSFAAADYAVANPPYELAPAFGEQLSLRADPDRIEALAADRAVLWDTVNKASFLTVNEQRAAVGYGAIEGGDVMAGAGGA